MASPVMEDPVSFIYSPVGNMYQKNGSNGGGKMEFRCKCGRRATISFIGSPYCEKCFEPLAKLGAKTDAQLRAEFGF